MWHQSTQVRSLKRVMKVVMVTNAGLNRTGLVRTSGQVVDQQSRPNQQTAENRNRRKQGHPRDEESAWFTPVRGPRRSVHGEILPNLHLGVVAVVHLGGDYRQFIGSIRYNLPLGSSRWIKKRKESERQPIGVMTVAAFKFPRARTNLF